MPQAEPTDGQLRSALADVIRTEREVQQSLRDTIVDAEQAIRESEARVNAASTFPAPAASPATESAPVEPTPAVTPLDAAAPATAEAPASSDSARPSATPVA